jgi:glycosyltransferase involved in cell wall biosynthesis
VATVLYFSKDYTPHDHRFLSALSETEHRVYYLRLERGPRQTEDRPVPSRIEEIPWAGGRRTARRTQGPRLYLELQRIISRVKPDLIHAGPIQTCGLLAALTGFQPLLLMSWGFDLMQDAERSPLWRWATRYALQHATVFTSDCEATRLKAIAYGVPENRTIMFPWGVDLGQFSPRQPLPGSQRRSPFILLCNRSWEPRYGVDVMVAAFAKAARQRPEMSLILLGGGSQGTRIRQILIEGGVEPQVTFGGQVPQGEMPRYYGMADLYVSPSHIDGSSVSLMEAMACGLPCVVSDIPANREWVAEGLNGWLFPDGDVGALAALILRLAAERDLLAKVGLASRRIAEEKADWKKNFQKLLGAYNLAFALAPAPKAPGGRAPDGRVSARSSGR